MEHNASTMTIREAGRQDDWAIARLAEDAGMGTLSPGGRSFVAAADGRVLGFVRITEAEGNRFVNPIAVDAGARRSGVGRALMEDARVRFGELLFVARGCTVPFYEALGCERVPLGAIAREIASDCDDCDDFAACAPVPMAFR